jgi:hypothetical protein
MDVYQIPFDFHNGLTTTYNNDITEIIAFYDVSIETVHRSKFDDHGNYGHHTVATHNLQEEAEF